MLGSSKMLTKCITTDININGTIVKKEKVIRYLGVWMDDALSFKYHVKMKCKSAMFNLVCIKRLRPSLTVEAANILVMGLVISHLDYANSILHWCTGCNSKTTTMCPEYGSQSCPSSR